MLGANSLAVNAGPRVLCRDLSFTVAPGQMWALLGCNGSGKTTLLHTLAGLIPPTSGNVTWEAQKIDQYPRRELARTLGLLLQREDHDYWGTLRDYIALGRYPHAHPLFGWNLGDEQAVVRALSDFDLDQVAAQPWATLSGGERQRARLAQLWTQEPRLYLLDEPLQHLDLKHQLQAIKLVRNATRHAGAGAIIVLHDPNFARYCDQILMLYGEGSYAVGSIAEMLVRERLETLYRCRLRQFGSATDMHFFPVI